MPPDLRVPRKCSFRGQAKQWIPSPRASPASFACVTNDGVYLDWTMPSAWRTCAVAARARPARDRTGSRCSARFYPATISPAPLSYHHHHCVQCRSRVIRSRAAPAPRSRPRKASSLPPVPCSRSPLRRESRPCKHPADACRTRAGLRRLRKQPRLRRKRQRRWPTGLAVRSRWATGPARRRARTPFAKGKTCDPHPRRLVSPHLGAT
jgi:hypothetical protein